MFRRFKLFKPLDPRITSELKAQRKTIIKGLICVVVTAALSGSVIQIVHVTVDAVATKNIKMLLDMSMLVVAIFAFKYWFTRGQMYYLSKAANALTASLRERIFDKLQLLPVSFFNETRTGTIQSVITNDVGLYQNAVSIIRDSIDGPIRALVAFGFVLYMQWQLGLVAIVFVPIMAAIIARNGRKMKQAQAQVQSDLADLQAMSQESLYGVRVIKAFSAEERTKQAFASLVKASYNSQMRAAKRVASLRPLVELVGALTLGVVVVACAFLVRYSLLTVGDLAAVLLALDMVNQGFRTIGYVNNTYNQVQVAADRIYGEILEQPIECIENPKAVVLPEVQGRIEFRDVSFAYPDGTQALRSVSFVIEPGSSLALVGYSGAGKSTIADLLLRFYEPTSGEILLDGHNIAQLKLSWLRSIFGVVPQHTFLFAGTIADNIRLGKEEATDEEIEAAAAAAHADVFVDQMPNRYQTVVGESGVGLSGGEKQRIAIARAVVRKPRLLLLDEATSSLDAVSEKIVQEALDEIMQDRTTLMIAHRLTSAARADRIMVLQHGEVVESGNHAQLMAKNSAYAAMYRAFSSGVLDETLV